MACREQECQHDGRLLLSAPYLSGDGAQCDVIIEECRLLRDPRFQHDLPRHTPLRRGRERVVHRCTLPRRGKQVEGAQGEGSIDL